MAFGSTTIEALAGAAPISSTKASEATVAVVLEPATPSAVRLMTLNMDCPFGSRCSGELFWMSLALLEFRVAQGASKNSITAIMTLAKRQNQHLGPKRERRSLAGQRAKPTVREIARDELRRATALVSMSQELQQCSHKNPGSAHEYAFN